MKITVYSTSTCPNCTLLKQHLDAKGLSYDTVVLDKDRDRLPEFQKVSGGAMTVPVTAIYKEEGAEPTVLHGFDTVSLDSALA